MDLRGCANVIISDVQMRKFFLIALIVLTGATAFAQDKPEKFSSDFLNCFLNYKETCAKNFITSDTLAQKQILAKLDELYKAEVKPNLRGKALSSSTRAVLKDAHDQNQAYADIFVIITADTTLKYELSLWGCYKRDGKWYLGEKIELKKI